MGANHLPKGVARNLGGGGGSSTKDAHHITRMTSRINGLQRTGGVWYVTVYH